MNRISRYDVVGGYYGGVSFRPRPVVTSQNKILLRPRGKQVAVKPAEGVSQRLLFMFESPSIKKESTKASSYADANSHLFYPYPPTCSANQV